jgi:hypothetical protein
MNSSQTSETKPQSSTQSSTGGRKSVVETAKHAAAEIKTAASATAHRAVEGVQQTVSSKKSEAADRVEAYGNAIHDSARNLEQEDPNIAWFTHQAADRLQRVASYVRDRDFQGFREDAENLARRHPVAFFGGLCLAGLVLGNVIKASRKDINDSEADEYAPDFGSQPEQDYAPSSASIDPTTSAEI